MAGFAYALGGIQLAMRVNAVVGALALLMVYSFASRMMRPALALFVEFALAANLVFVFYSRAQFSELLAMLFLFGGLTLLWDAQNNLSPRAGLAAGLVLGSASSLPAAEF